MMLPLGFAPITIHTTHNNSNSDSTNDTSNTNNTDNININRTASIYRSAYPADITHPFLRTLNLRTMICLNPSDVRESLQKFVLAEGITLVMADIGNNQVGKVLMHCTMVLIYYSGHVCNSLINVIVNSIYILFNQILQEPFVQMSTEEMKKTMKLLENPDNLPALIFCTTGKVNISI
jgi:protein tyrosine/serine phosphatase